MRAFLVMIGSCPMKISLSRETAVAYARKTAAARAADEQSDLTARGRSWEVRTREDLSAQEVPMPAIKIDVYYRLTPTKGISIVMTYRVYELDMLETPLGALAEAAE